MGYDNDIYVISGGGGSDEWQRPSNWLARPTIAIGEDAIYLLCRVTSFGDNWVIFACTNKYSVDWGYGAVEDFNSGISATKNLDYTQLTEWWDDTETDKQVWVKITPQSSYSIDSFYIIGQNLATKSTNRCVIEVLCGSLLNPLAWSAISMAQLTNCIAIKFYQNLYIQCYNFTNVFAYNPNLEIIEGNIEIASSVTTYAILRNCGKLKFMNLIIDGSCREQFSFCSSIKSVSAKKYTRADASFQQNFAMEKFELTDDDGSACNLWKQTFYYCNFVETPTLNLINSTDNTYLFSNNYNLKKSNLSNIKASIGFYSCNLNHAAIYEIFDEQLLTVDSAQTIDLRLNPDIANLPLATIAITTVKNWSAQIS